MKDIGYEHTLMNKDSRVFLFFRWMIELLVIDFQLKEK